MMSGNPNASAIVSAAIVGFGSIAHGRRQGHRLPMSHAAAYRQMIRRVRVAAIVDPDRRARALAKHLFPDAEVFSGVSGMLDCVRPDLVSVCSPDHLHADQLLQFAAAGARGIWCEKPAATSESDVDRLERLFNMALPVQVNYWRRFVPEIVRLRKLIASGSFGALHQASGFYPEGLARNGSHLLDLVVFLIGSPTIEYAVCTGAAADDPGIDILGTLPSGAKCSIASIPRRRYNVFELTLLFERARVSVTENGRRVMIWRDRRDRAFPWLRILNTRPRLQACNWKGAFSLALEDLAKCIAKGTAKTRSPLDDALRVSRLILDARRFADVHEDSRIIRS